MAGRINHLTIGESEDALAFLLRGMQQEQRRQLMIERPVLYVKLFPHTAHTVLGHVQQAVEQVVRDAEPHMNAAEREVLERGVKP